MTTGGEPTLAEFVIARIEEVEAVAQAAGHLSNGRRWWVDGPAQLSGKHWIYDIGEKFADRPVAIHIARHDPARVLARCAADRRIVELEDRVCAKRDAPAHYRNFDGGGGTFITTQPDGGGPTRRLTSEASDAFIDEWYETAPPSAVLRALGSVWADHEDWREEWRP